MSPVCRPAGGVDVDAVVRNHLAAFPGFFLTLLGNRFLARLYQGFASEHDVATLLVAECDGEIVGFLAGCRAPEEFFRRMRRKYGFYMAFVALPSVLRHPLRVLERLLAAARYRGDRPPDLPGYWLLSSLGVAPSRSGLGLGEALVARFCGLAREAGARGVYLLTDAAGNDRTLRFYGKCGFTEHSVLVRPDGRRLALITRSLSDE